MATDVLPAALARQTATPDTTSPEASRKPALLRRLFDAIVEAQTRRAEREIARLLRTPGLPPRRRRLTARAPSHARRQGAAFPTTISRKGTVMIATAIYILNAIRRALDKTGRGLSMLADAFAEAQEFRRAMRRKHRHVEE